MHAASGCYFAENDTKRGSVVHGHAPARSLSLTLTKATWSKSDAASFLSELDASTLRSLVLHDWHDLAGSFPVKVVSG